MSVTQCIRLRVLYGYFETKGRVRHEQIVVDERPHQHQPRTSTRSNEGLTGVTGGFLYKLGVVSRIVMYLDVS
jgi:hypothetical protein